MRHPRYKTEHCRTFATSGTCPYGTRCRFIHYRGAAPVSPLSPDPLASLAKVTVPPASLITPPPSPTARRSPPSSPRHSTSSSTRSLGSPGSPRLARASLAAGGGLLPSELALVSAAAAAARAGGSPKKGALPPAAAVEVVEGPRRLPVFATLCEEGKAVASPPASPRGAVRGARRKSLSSEGSEE